MIDNFRIEEFVSRPVLERYGESFCWNLLDPRLLANLDFIRKKLNRSITINNWLWRGEFSQRGFRENTSQIVKDETLRNKMYLSPHTQGKGIDFDVKGMTSQEVRNWMIKNKEEFPYPFRLENIVNWVHMDVMTDRFITFNP